MKAAKKKGETRLPGRQHGIDQDAGQAGIGQEASAQGTGCQPRSCCEKPAPGNGQPVTWNFKLLSHHMLDGFGGMGEGMSIQIAPDGRRILWLAHESAPKNFTAVDVSDPRKPKVVVQTDLPQAHMRSNSLETCGNIMAVAYQTQKKGLQPAGMELFDISVPEKPTLDLVLRLLGADLARRASALVLRRRVRPLRVGRARLHADASLATTSSTAASTCAIRRSRSRSAAGGCPARARATT